MKKKLNNIKEKAFLKIKAACKRRTEKKRSSEFIPGISVLPLDGMLVYHRYFPNIYLTVSRSILLLVGLRKTQVRWEQSALPMITLNDRGKHLNPDRLIRSSTRWPMASAPRGLTCQDSHTSIISDNGLWSRFTWSNAFGVLFQSKFNCLRKNDAFLNWELRAEFCKIHWEMIAPNLFDQVLSFSEHFRKNNSV